MQVSFSGLKLEEAHDIVFGTPMPNHWWVVHTGTNRTVISISGAWHQAEAITTALARLMDWAAIDAWDESEVERFAGRYLAQVEVPRYINDPAEWDDDVPYGVSMVG